MRKIPPVISFAVFYALAVGVALAIACVFLVVLFGTSARADTGLVPPPLPPELIEEACQGYEKCYIVGESDPRLITREGVKAYGMTYPDGTTVIDGHRIARTPDCAARIGRWERYRRQQFADGKVGRMSNQELYDDAVKAVGDLYNCGRRAPGSGLR